MATRFTSQTTLTKVARSPRRGWDVTCADGAVYSIKGSDTALAILCRRYVDEQLPVVVTYEHGWFYKDLIRLRLAKGDER